MASPTFQDLLDDYAEDIFIGRSEQLRLFERVLTAARPPCLILAVAGQGGVGKSTLLERFRRIAAEHGAPAALVNEDQSSVLAVLATMADQFRQQGHACATFDERYKKYRTLKEQVEADPHAPKGMLDFAVRSATRIGVKMVRRVPLIAEAADVLLDPDAEDQIVEESSALASYLAQKFTNKDERVLLLETDEQLTTHLVSDLHRHARERKVALLFDTYEKTSPYLDHWLRDLLAGKFGDLPGNIRLVIAGRYPLEQPWLRFRRATQQIALEPFTEEEARKYLAEADITDEQTVASYLRLSERLPVLLALLVAAPGDTPADLSADAVERFLQGLPTAEREAALLASVPRFFNRDILVALLGAEAGVAAFTWLSDAHFVRQAARGWVYHDVVRSLLLRYVRQRSAQECKATHRKLADYYHQQAADLQLPTDQQRINVNWREHEAEAAYHKLSANPPVALGELWTALLLNLLAAELPTSTDDTFNNLLKSTVANLKQVFDETADATLKPWAQAGDAALQSDNQSALRTLFQRLGEWATLESKPRSVAYMVIAATYDVNTNPEQLLPFLNKALTLEPTLPLYYQRRGQVYYQGELYSEALIDFNNAIEFRPDNSYHYFWRGATQYQLKLYEIALVDLSKAIELLPDDGNNYLWRGLTHYQLKAYDAALTDFSKAIELQPKDGSNYLWRGLTYYQLKAYDAALTNYSKAIELQPEDGNNYLWRGHTYYQLKAYDAALIDLSKAIELQPEDGDNYFGRGAIHYELKTYDAALSDLSKAIALQPENGYNYHGRGRTCYHMRDYNAALVDLNRAIELQPDNGNNPAWRGAIYLALGDTVAAEADFAQVEALLDETGSPAYVVAAAYARIGQVEATCRWLRLAGEREAALIQDTQTDADFDPVRNAVAFMELVAGFSTENKT